MPEESYCKIDDFQPVDSTNAPTTKSNNAEDNDDLTAEFPEIDHVSLYLCQVYFMLSIPMLLTGGFAMSWVFTTGNVKYRCAVTECENSKTTTLYPKWLPNAVPYNNDEPATCTRFVVENLTDSCATTVFTKRIESCNAWVYDSEYTTILNEWNLTCEDNSWKLTLPGVINNIGQIFGLLLTAYFPDKYGRRNVMVILTLLTTVIGISRAFSINYEMFVVLEFTEAIMNVSIYGTAFMLGMELVGPKKRALMSNVIGCMFPIGEALAALYAMWFRYWRHFMLVLYVPGLLMICLPFFVPESVRWLRSKNRLDDAEAVLRKIAAKNGVEVSDRSIRLIQNPPEEEWHNKSHNEQESSDVSTRKIFTNSTILLRLLFCIICWVASTFVYYGLSYQSVKIPGNKYINFILVALIEVPAHLISWFLMDYIGRKITFSSSLLLTGVFCLGTIFVPTELWFMPLILVISGKFFISLAFDVIYVFTIELFPTPTRYLMFSICSVLGRIGSVAAPLIHLLENKMPLLPRLVFGGVAILACVLSLSFPETVGKELPDTIHQAVNIGKQKKEETVKLPTIKQKPFS